MADTEQSLRKYLKKVAGEHKYVNPEIIIQVLSSGGGNYMSKVFTAVVREAGRDDLHLFAKIAAFGETLPNIYETENFAYTELIQLYETLERESRVLEEDRLVFCKFYGFDPTLNREILVLENLLPQGYGPHNRFQSVDWPYAAAAVRELAKMHALSFAFAKRYPEKFEKTLSSLKGLWYALPLDQLELYRTECAIKVINHENLDKFISYTKRRQFSILNLWKHNDVKVIIHGDYRGNNLLHRLRKVRIRYMLPYSVPT